MGSLTSEEVLAFLNQLCDKTNKGQKDQGT